MNKIFFLLLGAIFCLSCAHKIPPATVSSDGRGGIAIVAPSNEMFKIIDSVNNLPLACLEHGRELLAAARPEQNMVDINCSLGNFRLIIRPIPKIAKILVYNATQNKGYRAKILSSEGNTALDKYMLPESYEIIETLEGNYNYHFEAGGQRRDGNFLLICRPDKISITPFPNKPNQKVEMVDRVIELGWD